MKKTYILTFLLLVFALNGSSQLYKWTVYPCLGIDMGGAIPFPFSDIPKGSGGTPKLSPTLGIGGEFQIHDRWFMALEVNYHVLAFSAKAEVRSQPFYATDSYGQPYVLYFTGYTKADIELRQVEFPLIATYKTGKNWSVPFGVYYSRILEGSFYTEGSNGVLSDDKELTDNAELPGTANTSYNFNDDIDSYDYGILFGYRYNLNHRLYFWSKFHVGFKSFSKKEFDNIDYEMYQVRISIGASYNLFYSKQENGKENSTSQAIL
ncbi:hypothetical protein ES708_18333 [subsurface metagenome]